MKVSLSVDNFELNGLFTISRGAKSTAEVISVRVEKNGISGIAECVPYKRYGESVWGVSEEILKFNDKDFDFESLQNHNIKGAGKNALECAYLDYMAKSKNVRVWDILNLRTPKDILTAYTISLDTAQTMAKCALENKSKKMLKLKLGADGDIDRIKAVRQVREDARIVVDANEGWKLANLDELLKVCEQANIELIEQPLKNDDDDALKQIKTKVAICADESFMVSGDIPSVAQKYDCINIKLDKSGGLYDALKSVELAKKHNLKIMVGCMMGSSLAMAPAMLIASYADWVDLDGGLWLKNDRQHAIEFKNECYLQTPSAKLWG